MFWRAGGVRIREHWDKGRIESIKAHDVKRFPLTKDEKMKERHE